MRVWQEVIASPAQLVGNLAARLRFELMSPVRAYRRALEEFTATGTADAAYQIAGVSAWRRVKKDKAFERPERAYAWQDRGFSRSLADPLFAAVRAYRRFTGMLRERNSPC